MRAVLSIIRIIFPLPSAPARCAHQQPGLQQIGFDHLFQHVTLFRQHRCQRFHPDRPASIIFGKAGQIAPVHGVEAIGIHLEPGQRRIGNGCGHGVMAIHRRNIAHPPQ